MDSKIPVVDSGLVNFAGTGSVVLGCTAVLFGSASLTELCQCKADLIIITTVIIIYSL